MTPEHQSLVSEIHGRVGRNVIRVQALERGLKALVPLLDLQGKSHCFDGLEDRSAQSARNTLGQLVGSFLRSTSGDNSGFTETFEKIVTDRNNLVHHFHDLIGTMMSTSEGCVRAKQQLDEQFELIKLFENLVNALIMEVLHAIRDITFRGTTEHGDFAVLCDRLGAAFHSANLADFSTSPSKDRRIG